MSRHSGWALCVVWIAIAGCGSPGPSSDSRPPLHREAVARYVAGDIPAARQLFETGLAQATAAKDFRNMSRFHGGLGLCDFANHHYSRALAHYQEALASARQAPAFVGQADLCASASDNIASVYDRMGDFDNAIRANLAGQAFGPGPEQDSFLRLNLAILYAKVGRRSESEKAFRDLIARSRSRQDHQTLARSLENLGYQFTTQGRLLEAEPVLNECLQLRRARQDPELPDTYFVLASLRLAQGRYQEALADLDRYAGSGRSHYWIGRVHSLRGRILRASGKLDSALASFRDAVNAARARRIHIRPTANFLLSSETTLSDLYGDYIHAATAHYQRTGRRESLAEALAAAEESRVAAQRAAYFTPDRWADQYADYLQLLQQLDAAASAKPKDNDLKLNRLRLELVEKEAKMALDEPLLILPPSDPRNHLELLQAAVAPAEAVFVFHVSSPGSLGWLITREKVQPAQLPPPAELGTLVGRFVKLLKDRHPASREVGLTLFTKIFGEFLAAAATKLHWTFVLDGPLFEVPFPVLPVPPDAGDQKLGKQPTLVDRHAISLLPSFFPEGKAKAGSVNKLFAGIGDPVYNAADPRFSGVRSSTAVELARLPGTAVELERAAAVWKEQGFQTELLMGVEASSGRLRQVAANRPAILHLAAHVISADAGPRIAFSLLNGRLDSLGPRDFSFRVPGTLVMMAGCSSGRGAVLPGVGLMGLTRSWLLSGAEGVVANLWPVPDDTGDFPVQFYLRLSQLKNKNNFDSGSHRLAWAQALRQAALETRDAGRVPASTWSAYYLMGRN